MQTCYNCGKQVEDHVLICPECGALVKRYGRPEPQATEPEALRFADASSSAADAASAPRGAVFRTDSGKLKLRGGITFWLVLCAIFTGYSLLGFFSMLFIHHFQDLYFEMFAAYSDLAEMVALMEQLLLSFASFPVYYILIATFNAVELFGLIWFLSSKRRAAFWVYAGASVAAVILQLAMGGGLSVLVYLLGPVMSWLMLRKSWSLLR